MLSESGGVRRYHQLRFAKANPKAASARPCFPVSTGMGAAGRSVVYKKILKVRKWRAPCKGGVSQWVRIPPGNIAPAGSNRSSHGGNEVAEASDVTGHFR